ncbi:UNVERIFIED_CONTAM: hypothetical protein Slati_0204900 [Sesamum latifolium]|uniref:GAG-pre-integrase domain-containing protein n=1 Tax=Sesamum latifolium TaxID=2727402 RepID=A0AAW2YBN0_9LAMI
MLNGTPEWYKDLTDKKRKGTGRGRGLIAAVDAISQPEVAQLQGPGLTNIMRTEIRKLMAKDSASHSQLNTPFDDVRINFAQLEDLVESAGIIHHFNDIDCGSWIVDSGATRHVCADLKHFTSYTKPIKPTKVSLPDALHSVTDSSTYNEYTLWHHRLGHVSAETLKHISSIKFNKSPSYPCDVCHLAKQQRFSFPSSDTKVTSMFDLVHIDIWGPYKQPTPSNCSYFLTVVDHYSRSTWTYLMKFNLKLLITFIPSLRWYKHSSIKLSTPFALIKDLNSLVTNVRPSSFKMVYSIKHPMLTPLNKTGWLNTSINISLL